MDSISGVLARMGITFDMDVSFALVERGMNCWYQITSRDTAIKALQYKCGEGPPHIVVRRFNQDIWYEIGDTCYAPLCHGLLIKPELAEALIAEGILWMQELPEVDSQHCYYTGEGSYFQKHRKQLEDHKAAETARKRLILLNAFIRHDLEQYGGLVAEQATSPEHEKQLLVDVVKESYEGTGVPLPTDAEILAELRSVRSAKAA